jgi:predicted site-specific integrase-resolvase
MENFYPINKFAKIIGVTSKTLRNWGSSGKLIPHHRSDSGYRFYSESQLNQILSERNDHVKRTIGYCRVSSIKQKDDLERQVENMRLYLMSQGNPFEIITDIGSGINYKKSGLQTLLKMICSYETEKVVVLYKDRLVRFGFELIESVASMHGCQIEIIDTSEKSEQQELVEDLVQIITVFSCRLHGKRSGKAKKMIQELVGDDKYDPDDQGNAVSEQQTSD